MSEPLPNYDPALLRQLLLEDRDKTLMRLKTEAASNNPNSKALREIASRLEQIAVLLEPFPAKDGTTGPLNSPGRPPQKKSEGEG